MLSYNALIFLPKRRFFITHMMNLSQGGSRPLGKMAVRYLMRTGGT